MRLHGVISALPVWCLGEDGVSIGSGNAKSAHACNCRPGILRKVGQLAGDYKRIIIPGNGRVKFLQVEICGNPAMLEDKRCLDQSRDSRSSFGVSEVSFY